MRRRTRLATTVATLVVVSAAALIASIGTPRASAEAPAWGTFLHVASGDLGSSEARDNVVRRYDVLIVRGDLTAELFADLRARKPGITLLAYEKAAGLNPREVEDFEATHPEWIARDDDDDAIQPRSIDGTTLGDLTNAEFRAWQAAKFAGEVALGADGAFVDTAGAFFPDAFYTGRPVVDDEPITDAAWRDGSIDLLARIKAATGKTVVVNGFGLQNGRNYTEHRADSDQLIAAADGVQIEGFTRNGNTAVSQYQAASSWDLDLAFLESLATRGKLALAYTKVKVSASSSDLVRLRDYALASFLLGFASPQSYFGFDDGQAIPALTSDTTWARDLGAATSARTRSATTEWTRQFATNRLRLRAGGTPIIGTTSVTPPSSSTSTTRSTTSTTRASTSTTRASTSTTRASTSTTRASTTTIATRRTATFTGEGAQELSYSVTVGAGRVTARLTFGGDSERTLAIYRGDTRVADNDDESPVVVTQTLSAGTYRFVVRGPSTRAFTLAVDYPTP